MNEDKLIAACLLHYDSIDELDLYILSNIFGFELELNDFLNSYSKLLNYIQFCDNTFKRDFSIGRNTYLLYNGNYMLLDDVLKKISGDLFFKIDQLKEYLILKKIFLLNGFNRDEISLIFDNKKAELAFQLLSKHYFYFDSSGSFYITDLAYELIEKTENDFSYKKNKLM